MQAGSRTRPQLHAVYCRISTSPCVNLSMHNNNMLLRALPLREPYHEWRLLPQREYFLVARFRPLLGLGQKLKLEVPDDAGEDGAHFDICEAGKGERGNSQPSFKSSEKHRYRHAAVNNEGVISEVGPTGSLKGKTAGTYFLPRQFLGPVEKG